MKNHQGIARAKALAYSYVWWPGNDKEIETSVKACNHHTSPEKGPIHPWENTTSPGERIHTDLAGTLFWKGVFD